MPASSIIKWMSISSALFPIWTGRKVKGILWWYSLAALTSDLVFVAFNYFKAHGYWMYNLSGYWVYNLFVLVQFILISGFFIQRIFKPDKNAWYGGLAIMTAGCFLVFLLTAPSSKFNYTIAALSYAVFILLSIGGLYKVLYEIEFVRIERSPLFIFSTAILVYASGLFISYLFQEVLLQSKEQKNLELWKIWNGSLNTVKMTLIGYGLWLSKRDK